MSLAGGTGINNKEMESGISSLHHGIMIDVIPRLLAIHCQHLLNEPQVRCMGGLCVAYYHISLIPCRSI